MIEIDEVEIILNEIASEFPQEFYKELNGGIVLLPQAKLNPLGRNNELYVMGEYHSNRSMGRYIVIYYGSFKRLYGHLSRDALKKKLAQTLKHEFTHHLESLAGEHKLEKEDQKFLEDYLRRIGE
ncbi:MAG: metallopeptidase family protein [Clostridiales bacterium]|nr:metallopeptidase family protein [Clostridiales bacterium]